MRGAAPRGGRFRGRGSTVVVVATIASTMMAPPSLLFAFAGEVTAAFRHGAPPAAARSGRTGRTTVHPGPSTAASPLPMSRFCPLDQRSAMARGVATTGGAASCTVVPRMATTTSDEEEDRPAAEKAVVFEAERQPRSPIVRAMAGGKIFRLRRRLRRVGGAALAALALTVGRTDPAGAAVLQRIDKSPPAAATKSEAADLTSSAVEDAKEKVKADLEAALPEGEADLYESTSTEGSTSSEPAPPRNKLTPEEFAKLRRKDRSAPRLQRVPADETARLKYRQKQRMAELARRQKQMARANKSGQRLAIPLAGGFAALAVARHVVRSRREQNFVAQNIEKFEIQKQEFFNVTGKSESDDDLMESLRAAAATGNVTLDDDEDDEDDDDDDDEGGPPPAPRTPPTGGAGGGGGGGPPPRPKADGGGGSPAPPSASGGDEGGGGGDGGEGGGGRDGPASDEDVKKLDNLFKK